MNLKSEKYWIKLLSFLSILTAIFISLYVLFNIELSFDGAFHSQAALNLYQHGKYMLDYPLSGFTQIKVPFQLVNGFFLTLFGTNFISANLANILFYIGLLWFIFVVYKKYKTSFVFISFIAISFGLEFLTIGFSGYGEVPGLVLVLFGFYLLTNEPSGSPTVFWGAFLLGTAIATKWIFVLVLPIVGIVLLVQLLHKEYKYIFYTLLGGALALLLFWSIEYHNYTVDIRHMINSILANTKPVNNLYYSSYPERMQKFWDTYVSSSGTVFVALLKIIAYIQLTIISVYLLLKAVVKNKAGQFISSYEFFLLLLSLLAIEYFIWWMFISSKPWYRRGINADILLVISIALSIKTSFSKKTIFRISSYLSIGILILILAFNLYGFFGGKPGKQLLTKDKKTIVLESELSRGLAQLPEDYKAYGYGWWQAPRWSFISGKKFQDLYFMTIEDRRKIEEGSGKYYVFFEPVNYVAMKAYNQIHQLFKLSTVFEYNRYSIKQIVSKKDSTINFSLINYADNGYDKTEGVYRRENDFCWYSQNARIVLDSRNKTKFLLTYFIPDINKYKSPPYLSIYFNDDMILKKQLTKSGNDEIRINVDKKHKLKDLIVTIKVSEPVMAKGDNRNLGIPVRKIGFY